MIGATVSRPEQGRELPGRGFGHHHAGPGHLPRPGSWSQRGVPALGAAGASLGGGGSGRGHPGHQRGLSGAVEAAYAQKVTVPAGALVAGDVLRIRGRVRVTVGATTDTLATKVQVRDHPILLSVAATDYAADSCVSFDITMRCCPRPRPRWCRCTWPA